MDRRARLPKWAQDELSKLEADVAFWKEKARAAASHVGETEVVLEDRLGPDFVEHGLPPGSIVTFKLGPDLQDRIDVSVKESFEGYKYLHVMGRGRIAVKPEASNVVSIVDDEDREWRERSLKKQLDDARGALSNARRKGG